MKGSETVDEMEDASEIVALTIDKIRPSVKKAIAEANRQTDEARGWAMALRRRTRELEAEKATVEAESYLRHEQAEKRAGNMRAEMMDMLGQLARAKSTLRMILDSAHCLEQPGRMDRAGQLARAKSALEHIGSWAQYTLTPDEEKICSEWDYGQEERDRG